MPFNISSRSFYSFTVLFFTFVLAVSDLELESKQVELV